MNRNQKYIYPGPLWIPAQWLTGSPCKIKFTSLTQVLNSLIEAFFKNFISIIFSFRENGHQRAGMTLALNFCCRNYQLWTVTTSQVKFLSDNSSPGNNFNLGQATCLFFSGFFMAVKPFKCWPQLVQEDTNLLFLSSASQLSWQ